MGKIKTSQREKYGKNPHENICQRINTSQNFQEKRKKKYKIIENNQRKRVPWRKTERYLEIESPYVMAHNVKYKHLCHFYIQFLSIDPVDI